MSEQEKLEAIAKVKAQSYRKWLGLLILAPVLVCAGLTILAPTITNTLARQEANRYCAGQLTSPDGVDINAQVFVEDETAGGDVITAENIGQLRQMGEQAISSEMAQDRDNLRTVVHPDGNIIVFRDARPDDATRFFFCDTNKKALGATSADETAGEMVFSPDGTLLAIGEGQAGRVMLFDAESVERVDTINITGEEETRLVESIAFHPTEPLLFVLSEGELFVYETESFEQVYRMDTQNALPREIILDAEGRVIYFVSPSSNDPIAMVWGVGEQ